MQESNTRDAMLEKVKKLLSLASNQQGLPEGLTAMLKAQEMIYKFNIAEFELQQSQGIKSDPYIKKRFRMACTATPKDWRHTIYNSVASANFCKFIYHLNSQDGSIIGQEVNIQIVESMGEYIVKQVVKFGKMDWKNKENKSNLSESECLNSFCEGAKYQIYLRLKSQLLELESSSVSSNALVVCKNAELIEATNTLAGKLVQRNARKVKVNDSYYNGSRTGQSMSLRPEIH